MSRRSDAACGALSLAVLAVLRSALLSLDGQNKWPSPPSILSCLMFGKEGGGGGELFSGFNMLKAVLLFIFSWEDVCVSVCVCLVELSQEFGGALP